MRTGIRAIIIALIFVMVSACSGGMTGQTTNTDAELESGVGTVVNNPNPTQSKLEVVDFGPDIDGYIYDLSQIFDFDDILGASGQDVSEQNIAISRTMLLVLHSVLSIQKESDHFEAFGQHITDSLLANNITEVTETEQMLITEPVGDDVKSLAMKLLGGIKFVMDPTDPDYFRFTFLARETEDEYGVFLVKAIDGLPAKGLFVYYDPVENLKNRLTAFAFDFTNLEEIRMIVQRETFSDKLHKNIVVQALYECNASIGTCHSEYHDITTTEPERLFLDGLIAFEWNNNNDNICVSPVRYTEDDKSMLPPILLKDNLGGGFEACHFAITPSWEDHIFQPEDLFLRKEDTVPVGGTASLFAADWSKLTPTTIDDWLTNFKY